MAFLSECKCPRLDSSLSGSWCTRSRRSQSYSIRTRNMCLLSCTPWRNMSCAEDSKPSIDRKTTVWPQWMAALTSKFLSFLSFIYFYFNAFQIKWNVRCVLRYLLEIILMLRTSVAACTCVFDDTITHDTHHVPLVFSHSQSRSRC